MVGRQTWQAGALATVLAIALAAPGYAQTAMRKGVLMRNQMEQLATYSTTLSRGELADLQTDPNFDGDFNQVVNAAATILDGYTVVRRGGYFPENQGIPREQQLSVVEVVYQIFRLPSGNELVLYRTPTKNTADYFIRERR